jgi:hypothetical protein
VKNFPRVNKKKGKFVFVRSLLKRSLPSIEFFRIFLPGFWRIYLWGENVLLYFRRLSFLEQTDDIF